jgi:lysozyme
VKTSDLGIAFIKSFEQIRLSPYQDQAGLWTIGYGHRMLPDEDHDTITQDDADALFLGDLARTESAVNAAANIILSQNEYDACVSLCYNIGSGNFASSTLVKLLNSGNTDLAAQQFLRWDHAGGQVSSGLLARRVAEKAIFEGGTYTNHA